MLFLRPHKNVKVPIVEVVLGLTVFEALFQSLSSCFLERDGDIKTIEERKIVQTTSSHIYCKHSQPLPYSNPMNRTPRH